jgi:hypothetical protein
MRTLALRLGVVVVTVTTAVTMSPLVASAKAVKFPRFW